MIARSCRSPGRPLQRRCSAVPVRRQRFASFSMRKPCRPRPRLKASPADPLRLRSPKPPHSLLAARVAWRPPNSPRFRGLCLIVRARRNTPASPLASEAVISRSAVVLHDPATSPFTQRIRMAAQCCLPSQTGRRRAAATPGTQASDVRLPARRRRLDRPPANVHDMRLAGPCELELGASLPLLELVGPERLAVLGRRIEASAQHERYNL
jgi:hypothetical protein